MRFICQVSLDDAALDLDWQGQMAYLFMTDDEVEGPDGRFAEEQYHPELGENAVILQPGGDRIVETSEIIDGPSLQLTQEIAWGWHAEEPSEFAVRLLQGVDPELTDAFESADDANAYYRSLSGNKLGGTPGFCQGAHFPFPSSESLQLLQLDMGLVPFFVGMGDMGVGHVFVHRSENRARFQWDCH